jgi:DNA-binding response OmpR family regulator
MAIVLIVDDEDLVTRIIRIALERVHHSVFTASSAAEAYQAATEMVRVDLLIVDHRVSPDRGRDIAERLLLTHPEMRVMHISGWLRPQLESEGGLTLGAAFLSKPFTILQIQAAVGNLLASTPSA